MLRSLALTLLFSSSLQAELIIRAGGERIVAFRTPTCGSTMYSPSLLVDREPALEGRNLVMYSAGGVLHDPCTNLDLMSPQRFGDKIWYHWRDSDGNWRDRDGDPETIDAPILDRSSFSWMGEREYLTGMSASYVGHLSSPSVVKIGNRYFMIFVASINDPNLCAGEHFDAGTPCGSCRARWSWFTAMWAVSDDGVKWRVFEGPPKSSFSHRAIDSSVLWMPPFGNDVKYGLSHFKGIARTTMVVREENGETFFYIGANFWGRHRVKTAMFRIRYDADSEWGWSSDPQLWDTQSDGWRACTNGLVPLWLNDDSARGSVLSTFVGNISEIRAVRGYRYIATLPASSNYSVNPADRGVSNAIAYQLSNDLLHWSEAETVESWIPYFADGSGYDVSVTDPFYLEERGFFHFYFASADGNRDRDRDGFHDCDLSLYSDNPTAPYIGMGIYVGSGNFSRRNDGIKPVPDN